MNQNDNRIRKQWLLCYAFGLLLSIFSLTLQAGKDPTLDLFPMGRYGYVIVVLLAYVLFGYIFYRCAYKKPGTKLLMTCLVFTIPSLVLTPILYLKGIIRAPAYIPYYGAYLLLSQGLGVWWVIASWRMRQVNKRMRNLSTPTV